VSGSSRREAGQIILSVEFAETESRHVLWADRYRLADEQLVSDTGWIYQTASSIRKALMVREVARVHALPIESLKLYSLLHGAVGLMHRLSARDFNHARQLLCDLKERAPLSPAPRAWLARWHVLRVMQGWSNNPQADASAAMEFSESALEMDPDNPLALSSLGFVMTNLLRRLEDARACYDAALEIYPNDAQAQALRGMMLAFHDEGEKGRRDTERALHLTPRDPHRFFYLVLAAGANLSAGHYDRAVTLATESRRLKRTHVSTLRTLAAAQAGAGMGDAARRTVSELMCLQPDLTVRRWQASAPSADYENGRRFATLLREAGVPH
jgi:tetratricopeptide (TPR) repeat protein